MEQLIETITNLSFTTSDLLLLGIGIIPGVVFLLVSMAIRKSLKVKLLISLVLSVLLIFGSLFFVYPKIRKSDKKRQENSPLSLANALVLQGDLDDAEKLVDEYADKSGYDNECRLLAARISFFRNDLGRAAVIYGYLNDYDDSGLSEQEKNIDQYFDDCDDVAPISYLEESGQDLKEYGYENISDVDSEYDKIHKAIENRLDDGGGKYERYASFISNASSKDYSGYDLETAKELNNSNLADYDSVKSAVMGSMVDNGDYEYLISNNDDNAYKGLIVSSKLYINGVIDENTKLNLKKDINRSDKTAVSKQLKKVYEVNQDELNNQDLSVLKDRIEALNSELKESTLSNIKEELIASLDDISEDEISKVYMGIAQIESYYGNEKQSSEYIVNALNTSANSNDYGYVLAMNDLNNYVHKQGHAAIANLEQTINNAVSTSSYVESPLVCKTDEKFASDVSNTLSTLRTSIKLNSIDASGFPEIRAKVILSNVSGVITNYKKNQFLLKDCGEEIEEFDLERISYDHSNIILLCDNSGSMSSNVESLKKTAEAFVMERGPLETLGIYNFDDYIINSAALGSSEAELLSCIESISARGGTRLYDSIIETIGLFTAQSNFNNVLIVLTDGMDNYPRNTNVINTELKNLAEEKGVIIFTVGLGNSVDSNYLEQIADAGNGKFMYVSSSIGLGTIYNEIHAQLNNQYNLRYIAKNRDQIYDRELFFAIRDDQNSHDRLYYSLAEKEKEEEIETVTTLESMTFYGVSPRSISYSKNEQKLTLKGEGFDKDLEVSAELTGPNSLSYSLKLEYVDDKTYELTVPGDVVAGVYDIKLSAKQKSVQLYNALSVCMPGNDERTSVGKYVFISNSKYTNNDGSVTLTGNVRLNEWLHFNGDITLEFKDNEHHSAVLCDAYGSYVEFNPTSAKGLAKVFADRGEVVEIKPINRLQIYDEDSHYDKIDNSALKLTGLANLMFSYELHPDQIKGTANSGTITLPFIDKILNYIQSKKYKAEDIFNKGGEFSFVITNNDIGAIIDIERVVDGENDKKSEMFIGLSKIKYNSYKGEAEADFKVKNMLGMDNAKFSFGWEGSWVPKKFTISDEVSWPVTIFGIPAEIDELSLGVNNLDDFVIKNDYLGIILNGGISLKIASLESVEFIPKKLVEFLDDPCLLSIPESELSLRLKPFTFEGKAELNALSGILGEDGIKISSAETKWGNYEYTNDVLYINKYSTVGMMFKGGLDTEINLFNEAISLKTKAMAELAVNDKFKGLSIDGGSSLECDWWFLDTDFDESCKSSLGLYSTSDGKMMFVFAYKGFANNEVYGNCFYVDEDLHIGSTTGRLG